MAKGRTTVTDYMRVQISEFQMSGYSKYSTQIESPPDHSRGGPKTGRFLFSRQRGRQLETELHSLIKSEQLGEMTPMISKIEGTCSGMYSLTCILFFRLCCSDSFYRGCVIVIHRLGPRSSQNY